MFYVKKLNQLLKDVLILLPFPISYMGKKSEKLHLTKTYQVPRGHTELSMCHLHCLST